MANNSGRKRRFGATRQLPSGRWQIRYPDPVTKQLRPGERTFDTKGEAEIALSVIEADQVRGRWTDPDAGKVNFGEFADEWLRDRKLADTTRERYAVSIRLYLKPTFGAGTVADITPSRVRSWRAKLLTGGSGEPSVVKAYQILRAILNTAVDDELIQRNPCRIKGADSYDVPERPVLSVSEVFAAAAFITPHSSVSRAGPAGGVHHAPLRRTGGSATS